MVYLRSSHKAKLTPTLKSHLITLMDKDTTQTETQWANIDALMEAGGQITLGRMAPLDGVAVAARDRDLYAALRRRPDETVSALLQRLDQAIGTALNTGVWTNEIDDSRYVLKQPGTRKRR
jgi:hypothetical protein